MELVRVYNTGRTVDFQTYDDKDNQLIVSSYTNTEMDPNADVVEVAVYGESGEFLDYNQDVTTYKVSQGNVNPTTGFYTKIELDPKTDVNALGLTRGRVNAQYNFLKPLFNSSNINKYWIKEVSPSGTELKLSSQNLSNELIRSGFSSFQDYVSTKNYYVDFYLNFGQNRLVIANNALLSEESGEVYLLIKLYEPLPEDFGIKDTLWICDKTADSVIYTIDTQIVEDQTVSENALRGPNNRIKVRDRVGQTTQYYSYASLFSSTVSSSTQQLLSYYEDKAIEINVDYSDFVNFIHFSSATERINNFVYKLGLIEQYKAEIADTTTYSSMSPTVLSTVSQSNALAQKNIDSIINKFDTYEYYLYFSSESFAWPKSNSTKPYELYSVTSSQAIAWLGNEYTHPSTSGVSILYSASFYDNTNKDKLSNAIPQYLLEDANNQPYVTFVDMVGQHFDNLWLYYKDLSNRYSSFNNPNLGLSKDMVADALRGFGFNLYTNTSVSDNLYYTLFGVNQDGSLLPPTGSELINEYVTSSIDTLSPKQLDAEVYKRMYHNLSYLLKTKGTQRAVKALIACYGIPEDILDVNEFGGNSRYTGSGIYEINDQKINYFTQSAELSNPVLSPYVTLQQYDTTNRLNTNDIEAAFSPSNTINQNFVSSSGFVNIDQLIGNPAHQSLDYYPDLKTVRDDYFASYNYPHSIWEYIRIIKYYNNSLFKTIKDWVPARANASTGIVIKSHILERNKYARHEPSMSFDNNISESIDMVSIVGSYPGAVQGSTQYTDIINTSLGYVTKDYTEDLAKFTGRLSGSFVQATTGDAFDQSDYSTTTSGSVEIDFPANYQNATIANRSKRFFELDYGYNQNVPTNFGLVTQSINNSINNNFNTYNNPNSPYADIQDYNYATRAFTDARYFGSKTTSQIYNTYTAPVSGGYIGDSSYGRTAAIDRNSIKVGWVKNFQSSSLNFYDKTSITLKYLVDENQNLVELNQRNNNLFDVQNTFKSGRHVVVSLSDLVKPSFQKNLDGTKTIFRGGFSYDPILFREGNEKLTFIYPFGSIKDSQDSGFRGIEVTSSIYAISGLIDKNRSPYQSETAAYTHIDALLAFQIEGQGGNPISFQFPDPAGVFLSAINKYLVYGATGNSRAPSGNGYLGKNEWEGYSTSNFPKIHVNWGSGGAIGREISIFGRAGQEAAANSGRNRVTNYNGDIFWHANWQLALGRKDYETTKFRNLNDESVRIYEINNRDLFKNTEFLDDQANGGYYADYIDLRPQDKLYVAQRTSTFKISMRYYVGIDISYFKFCDWANLSPSTYVLNDDFYGPVYTEYSNDVYYYTPYHAYGVTFKLFLVVEKRTNPNSNDWTIIGHSRIKNKTYQENGSNIRFNSDYNLIQFPSYNGWNAVYHGASRRWDGELNYILKSAFELEAMDGNSITVDLNEGDELRVRLMLMDMDKFFQYGYRFELLWGNLGQNRGVSPDALPYFEIVDLKNKYIVYNQQVELDPQNKLFTAQNNKLIFTDKLSPFILDQAIFSPSENSAVYYSPVLDPLSIQKDDLIRLSQFKNPQTQYYTVITSSFSFPSGIVGSKTLALQNNVGIVTAIFNNALPKNGAIFIPIFNGLNPNAFEFFDKIWFSQSKQFSIKNVSPSNYASTLQKTFTLTTKPVKSKRRFASGAPEVDVIEFGITGNDNFINTLNNTSVYTVSQDGTYTGGIVCEFEAVNDLSYNKTLTVTLDRDVNLGQQNNLQSNFAVLRPKPDETSVIIEHRKLDGNVSQAILVPDDANNSIKEKTGDIFKALNTDLTNTNDSQTN
jgi:hypothetical protein